MLVFWRGLCGSNTEICMVFSPCVQLQYLTDLQVLNTLFVNMKKLLSSIWLGVWWPFRERLRDRTGKALFIVHHSVL